MYTGQADLLTYLIYILMGLFCWFAVKTFLRTGATAPAGDGSPLPDRQKKIEHVLSGVLFVLVLALFAALRAVGEDIGGSDATVYVDYFKNATGLNYYRENPYGISEPLFFLYNFLFRGITGNFRVFFFVTYGFIAFSYLWFIREYVRDGEVASPFLLVVFLYLKSFCTLRTSFAVAVYLIALTVFKRHKIASIPLFILPIFIHRMSVLYAILPIFYYFYRFVKRRVTVGWQILVFSICVGCSVAGAILLRELILSFHLISGLDASYIENSRGVSLVSQYPMYFSFLLLGLLLRILIPLCYKKRNGCDLIDDDLFFLFVFDVIVFPASLVLGMWRANEYLYLARLALWATAFPALVNLTLAKYKKYLYLAFAGCFFLWLAFRLYSEWDALKIMPYIPFFL